MAQLATQNGSPLSTNNAKEVAEEFKRKQGQLAKLEASITGLPESIARVDRKISLEDSAITFVVVKEMHHNENLPKETRDAALKCQAELNVVLKKINENLGSFGVLKDGMDPSIAIAYSERIDHFYKHAETAKTIEDGFKVRTSAESEKLLDQLKNSGANQKIINAVGFLMEYQKNRETLFEKAKTDSVMNLALKRSVVLSGPEDKKLVEQSLELARRNPEITVDDPAFKAISEKRETHIIEQVAKEKGPIVVGVFGGSHDFSQEIEAWNKKNPDKKIAFIEITPKEYSRYFKE